MSTLFRKEVYQKQNHSHFGDVVIASPLSHKSIIALLTLIMTGFLIFTFTGEYSRKERVNGSLVPNQGIIRILPQQRGTIEKIYVKIGDEVKKGDQLISVKIDTISGNGLENIATLRSQMENERKELIDRRALIHKQFSITKQRLIGQMNAASAEATRLERRIDLQRLTVKNEKIVLDKFEKLLENQAASSLEASSQENRYLQASRELENLLNEKVRYTDQSADLEAQLTLLPISEQQELSDLDSRLSSLQQRITQTLGNERYIITASVSGRIASLTAREGQVVDSQRALAMLLPIESKLEAEILLPSRAAGFIKKGQTVRFQYDAFPYQKFGTYEGTITHVSRTVLAPSDLNQFTTVEEPVFIITAELSNQFVDVNTENYSLQAGMTFAADIILEERKIWEWALAPLLGSSK